jgi:uncharacterized protein (TIGR02145 family)
MKKFISFAVIQLFQGVVFSQNINPEWITIINQNNSTNEIFTGGNSKFPMEISRDNSKLVFTNNTGDRPLTSILNTKDGSIYYSGSITVDAVSRDVIFDDNNNVLALSSTSKSPKVSYVTKINVSNLQSSVFKIANYTDNNGYSLMKSKNGFLVITQNSGSAINERLAGTLAPQGNFSSSVCSYDTLGQLLWLNINNDYDWYYGYEGRITKDIEGNIIYTSKKQNSSSPNGYDVGVRKINSENGGLIWQSYFDQNNLMDHIVGRSLISVKSSDIFFSVANSNNWSETNYRMVKLNGSNGSVLMNKSLGSSPVTDFFIDVNSNLIVSQTDNVSCYNSIDGSLIWSKSILNVNSAKGDKSGNLYVSTANGVEVLNSSGEYLFIISVRIPNYETNCLYTDFDSNGDVYILGHRISGGLNKIFVAKFSKCSLLSMTISSSKENAQLNIGESTTLKAMPSINGGKFVWSTGEITPEISLTAKLSDSISVKYFFETCSPIESSIYLNVRSQNEIDDYNRLKDTKRISDFKDFLNKYPNSDFKFEVDTLYSFFALKIADSINTIESYKSFIDSFYYLPYQEYAQERILSLVCKTKISTINKLSDVNRIINQIRNLNSEYNLGFDFNNLYHFGTTQIESGNWTYKNLNVSHFANGDSIPEAKTKEEWVKAAREKKPAWCYYENNSEDSYNKGKLYNWYAISDSRGLTTSNYYIPSYEDIQNLITDAGGSDKAGLTLKCAWSWADESENEYFGFDATPVGYRDENGNFLGKDETFRNWTLTEEGENAYYLGVNKNSNSCNINSISPKGFGYSVRMIGWYEGMEYSQSEILDSLIQKRNELILKEYSLIKDFSKIDQFLFKQIKSELGINHLKDDEINQAQFSNLVERFYRNEQLVKNGNFLIPPYYWDYLICGGDGDGELNPEVIHGFKNNVLCFIKWENGATYKGETENGLPNGKGVYINGTDNETGAAGGNVYDGTFVDGEMTFGTIKFRDKRVYSGECSYWQPNGQGTMTLVSGVKQVGKFIDGVYQKPFQCKSTTIGSQVWMAENLAVTKFRNGDPIPEAKSISEWVYASQNKQPVWCYYNNDIKNGLKYGKLYNWHAVNDPRGLAPEGWHVPSIDEWETLENYLYNNQGKKMKSVSGWSKNRNGTDESGFHGLPGGRLFGDGSPGFNRIGESCFWWSTTRSSEQGAYIFSLLDYLDSIFHDSLLYDRGCSVRCVKD